MADRNNIGDIYQIVSEDINWIIEDMMQHRSLLKEKMMSCMQEDSFEESDDYRQKYGDIQKLITKLENLKQEYATLTKGESDDDIHQKSEYVELDDWTDMNPETILLFNKKYQVKYWRDILLTMLEELNRRNKEFIDNLDKNADFKGRTRAYFTYDSNLIDAKLYKKLPNGLYVLVNNSANSMVTLCRKLLRVAGYNNEDLKIKIEQNDKAKKINEEKLEMDSSKSIIKLPRKYGSISIDKHLFTTIVKSILNRKDEYGTEFIEPRKIEQKYEDIILTSTKYTTAYHVVINIIKYLKDSHFLNNYADSKKGKYIVVDNGSLQAWIENNIN